MSYKKTLYQGTENETTKQFWMVSWLGDDEYTNFKTFESEAEYMDFINHEKDDED